MNIVVNVSALSQSIGIALLYRDIAPGLFTHGREHSHQKETLKKGASADAITCREITEKIKLRKSFMSAKPSRAKLV